MDVARVSVAGFNCLFGIIRHVDWIETNAFGYLCDGRFALDEQKGLGRD